MGIVKDVFVSPYMRYRLGRWEHVCAHFRSSPGTQLMLNL